MKILLVEDEAAIVLPLRKLLERQGWAVTAAATVAEALEAMEREIFDAALVDLGLPDGSGEEVCCALRRRKGPERMHFGALTVDRRSARVFVGETQITLTAQEYRLLLVFLSNPGQILERGQLLQALWDQEGNFVNDNTLTVTVKRLREKLAEGCGWHIATVRGLGYRWEEEPDA